MQEELRKGKREEESETLFISKTKNKMEETNLAKSNKKPLSKEELSKVTCYYCNKKGHFANKCFKRIHDKNKEGEEAHHTQEGNEYLFSSSTTTHLDNLWYLDSGATMHMAYKRNIFKNYTKLEKPRMVKMGDHNIQKGIGIGDVHFNTRHEKFGILSKVLHMPGLNKNLLSISKINDLGFTVNFDREKYAIFNNQMKQIVGGSRIRNLYSLSDILVNDDLSLNTNTSETKGYVMAQNIGSYFIH